MAPVTHEISSMSPDRVLTRILAVDLLLVCEVKSMEQIAGCVGEGDEVVISKDATFWRLFDQRMTTPSSHPETTPSGQAQMDRTLALCA